jgi:hypothetical protein
MLQYGDLEDSDHYCANLKEQTIQDGLMHLDYRKKGPGLIRFLTKRRGA